MSKLPITAPGMDSNPPSKTAGKAASTTIGRLKSSPLAVAMSGSGPSLFALFTHRTAAEAAHARLAVQLEQAGFEAWCCGFSRQGVSLDP